MKTLLLLLTYLVGTGELILGIYFWKSNNRNEIRRVMALLSLATSLWVICSGLTSYVVQTPLTTIFMQIVFISGAILVTSLVHLALVFPNQLMRFDKIHAWLFYFPTLFWAIIIVFSNTVVIGFSGGATDSGRIMPGPLYAFYNSYVFALYVAAIIIFFKRLHTLDGIHRRNLRLIAWSFVIGGLPAVMIDLIIPIALPNVFPNALFGAIATLVWLGTTAKIILTNE